MAAVPLPTVGTRFSLSGAIGSVRYVGPVGGTNGTWIGVEWDDEARGKHDGTKDGQHYFHCRLPTAGSFIRPSRSINYGQTFVDAITSKYIEVAHGSQSAEKVLLGSSNGVIQVEAVNLDKIRSKLSRLERLREVSLDTELVASGDPPGLIAKTCPNIRGLDLSQSLIPSWLSVDLIIRELPVLERLSLNRNRFSSEFDPDSLIGFRSVRELQLNRTGLEFRTLTVILPRLEKLERLEFGYNGVHSLVADTGPVGEHLEYLNLDGNEIADWTLACASLQSFRSLRVLILTANCIESIPPPANPRDALSQLTQLFLSFNRLSSWTDFDHLALWCPQMESLSVHDNPVLTDSQLGPISRPLIIPRIVSLRSLNGSGITLKERTDCELFYLSWIVHNGPADEAGRILQHPQWKALCDRHGEPLDTAQKNQQGDALRNRLITIDVVRVSAPPSAGETPPETADSAVLKALPTMSLRALRMKAAKTLRAGTGTVRAKGNTRFWLKTHDGGLNELKSDRDTKELGWIGFEEGTTVYVYME